jgi:uncharacterized protein (TIGR02284 family)
MPEQTTEHVKETLYNLIETLKDGHQGFVELEKHLKDPNARTFFLKETQVRANFAAELENELHRLGVRDVKEDSSISSKLQRTWGELKAKLGGGDHALLATAEKGEDEAKKAYSEALQDQNLPLPIRELISTQQEHILQVHDRVKAMRDAAA